LNVILPLVNEGKFNGYQLGSQWAIICASNRAEDDGGQSEIGTALSNRFTQLHYEPTVHTWRKWADKQGFMSPLLLQWLSLPASENLSGGKFFYMDPNEWNDSGDDTTLMCTPRAWTNAMRRLAKYSHTGSLEGFTIFDIPTRTIQRVLNGCVPASAVDSFVAFLDVIHGIGDFDRMVRDVWDNGGGSFKLDKKTLNKISLPIAQLICTAHCESLPSEKEFENLCNWLVAQNSDQLASYVIDIFKHVFDANDNLGNALFVIREKMKKFADPEFVKKNNIRDNVDLITGVAEKFAKAHNIDAEDIPNYYNGLIMLSKKYKDAFKAMHDDLENA
ncbi:MAG: hypothetical protein IKU29_01880, partial [Parabacteroides sp.]|nr:hypothetical protein [Parabacteroides sp.]